MSDLHSLSQQALQFYATAPHACSYLEEQQAASLLASPARAVNAPVYSRLIEKGFRRSGQFTYRPFCDDCQACISLRVPVSTFTPSRTQRRVANRLCGLQVHISEPYFDERHYQLYERYTQARHPGPEGISPQQYEQFLLTSMVETKLLTFSCDAADNHPGQVKIVSIIDRVENGLSAVYTFYDPTDAHASYGTYAVVWLIEYAKTLGLPYLYLGYWIAQCRKMAYKTNFRPFEVLTSQGWQLSES